MGRNWIIDPTGSLGPLKLGMTLDEAFAAEDELDVAKEIDSFVTAVCGHFTLVAVDGVVTMLVAELESQSPIAGSEVVVGMSYVSLLEKLRFPLSFDEENDLWRSEDFDRVFFAIARPGDPGIDSEEYVPQPYAVNRPEESIVHSILLQ